MLLQHPKDSPPKQKLFMSVVKTWSEVRRILTIIAKHQQLSPPARES